MFKVLKQALLRPLPEFSYGMGRNSPFMCYLVNFRQMK